MYIFFPKERILNIKFTMCILLPQICAFFRKLKRFFLQLWPFKEYFSNVKSFFPQLTQFKKRFPNLTTVCSQLHQPTASSTTPSSVLSASKSRKRKRLKENLAQLAHDGEVTNYCFINTIY